MTDRLYVDVSCVRIQSYLGRTPRLRGRRGASAAITSLADPDHLHITGGTSHDEAGEADGVVHLVTDLPSGGDREVDTVATDLAQQVFRRMRDTLPAAEFQAVWGVGDGYLNAHHRQIGPRLRRGDVLADLPAHAEVPYVRLCGLCHLDPAVKPVRLASGQDGVTAEEVLGCADCAMRFDRQQNDQLGAAERRLLKRCGEKRGKVLGTVEHLTELAGHNESDTDRNQVGTVFIDGNAFGDFFDQLGALGADLPATSKTAISRDLNEQTRAALEIATLRVMPEGDDKLCVVPHLVGGDDVLVSLPADRAWPFTRHYLREFEELVAIACLTTLDGLPAHVSLPALSASAGLVFSHHTEPFNLVVEAAGRRLAAAKSLVRGKQASVAATDLTTGVDVPAVCLADLGKHQKALTDLAGLSQSARHTLADLIRRAPDNRDVWRNQAHRLGHYATIKPFLVDDAPIDLPSALEIVRWWR